jgi:hypothetical protein
MITDCTYELMGIGEHTTRSVLSAIMCSRFPTPELVPRKMADLAQYKKVCSLNSPNGENRLSLSPNNCAS